MNYHGELVRYKDNQTDIENDKNFTITLWIFILKLADSFEKCINLDKGCVNEKEQVTAANKHDNSCLGL